MDMSIVEECSKVVKQVIDGGAFDEIRKKVLEELKKSPTLHQHVADQVNNSKTLKDDANRKSKDRKKVLEELQKELQDKLVDKASREVWGLLNNQDGHVAKAVQTKVHEALCDLYTQKQQAQQGASTSGRPAAPQHQAGQPGRVQGPGPSTSTAGNAGRHGYQEAPQSRAPG